MNKVNAEGTLSERDARLWARGEHNNTVINTSYSSNFFALASAVSFKLQDHWGRDSHTGINPVHKAWKKQQQMFPYCLYIWLLEIICWFAARYPIVSTNNHNTGLPTGPCLEEITGFLWVLSGSGFCKGFSSFIGCHKPQSWSHSSLLPSLISLFLM